jgi:hypothetical protein
VTLLRLVFLGGHLTRRLARSEREREHAPPPVALAA